MVKDNKTMNLSVAGTGIAPHNDTTTAPVVDETPEVPAAVTSIRAQDPVQLNMNGCTYIDIHPSASSSSNSRDVRTMSLPISGAEAALAVAAHNASSGFTSTRPYTHRERDLTLSSLLCHHSVTEQSRKLRALLPPQAADTVQKAVANLIAQNQAQPIGSQLRLQWSFHVELTVENNGSAGVQQSGQATIEEMSVVGDVSNDETDEVVVAPCTNSLATQTMVPSVDEETTTVSQGSQTIIDSKSVMKALGVVENMTNDAENEVTMVSESCQTAVDSRDVKKAIRVVAEQISQTDESDVQPTTTTAMVSESCQTVIDTKVVNNLLSTVAEQMTQTDNDDSTAAAAVSTVEMASQTDSANEEVPEMIDECTQTQPTAKNSDSGRVQMVETASQCDEVAVTSTATQSNNVALNLVSEMCQADEAMVAADVEEQTTQTESREVEAVTTQTSGTEMKTQMAQTESAATESKMAQTEARDNERESFDNDEGDDDIVMVEQPSADEATQSDNIEEEEEEATMGALQKIAEAGAVWSVDKFQRSRFWGRNSHKIDMRVVNNANVFKIVWKRPKENWKHERSLLVPSVKSVTSRTDTFPGAHHHDIDVPGFALNVEYLKDESVSETPSRLCITFQDQKARDGLLHALQAQMAEL